MYWNWDTSIDHVVFRWWSVRSPHGLVLSCLAAAVLAGLTQAVSGYRLYLEAQTQAARHRLITEILGSATAATAADAGRAVGRPKRIGVLFALHTFLAAVVMLVIMSLNGYLIWSCVLGAAVGYYTFGRPFDVECH